MLKRKAYDALVKWKETSQGSTAALIEGARRIGKTTVAKAFAEAEYKDYMILDFSFENDDVKNNFKDNIGDLDDFFRNLFLFKGHSLPPKQSVIIFDEVQLFPLARQAIKALVADGRYDYIETGSLISIKRNVQDILIPSEEHRIKMYPLDFEEFLWARGREVAVGMIQEAFQNKKALPDDVHRMLMKEFRTYVAVGGMPQAVVAYIEGEEFAAIDFVKQSILDLYLEDINKYSQNNRRVLEVYKSIPEQLSHNSSVFKFSTIGKDERYQTLSGPVDFLCEAMIVNRCDNVTVPDLLLDLNRDSSNFKLYSSDTGLLVTQAMSDGTYSADYIYRELVSDRISTNMGMIMENVVAQMLVASGHPLRFHEFMYRPKDSKEEKRYEIDFLLVRGRRICPIEVKSSGYKAHKSLDYLYEKYNDLKSNEKYIVYTKNLDKKDGIVFIPFYMAMCL